MTRNYLTAFRLTGGGSDVKHGNCRLHLIYMGNGPEQLKITTGKKTRQELERDGRIEL